MPRLIRAIKALASRKAATRDFERVLATPSFKTACQEDEGRMIFFLFVCLAVSLVVIAVADEIEWRANGLIDTVDVVTDNCTVEKDGGLDKKHPESSTPSTTSNNEQPTLQELDDLVNDIVKKSPRRPQKEVSETTRQFDDIIKYDNFLKFLKS
jgi:hypothetical protein